MIIHTYFTDGMYGWAKLFLESYIFTNQDSNCNIIVDSRFLTPKQISNLKLISPLIEIRNKNLNLARIAKSAGITKAKLIKYKKEVENIGVTSTNKIWKQLISVEDRYKNSIKDLVSNCCMGTSIMHIDIDMYFVKDITKLTTLIENHDISIRFRPKNSIRVRDNREVLGNIVGITINARTLDFLDRWRFYIDKISLKDKPKGYGQTSFYYAYKDLKNKLNWGNIPAQVTSVGKNNNSMIWTGNKGKKNSTLRRYTKHFNEVTNGSFGK